MIREGQDVNEKTQEKGNSALHIAARHGHYLIVKYLLDIGAEIVQTNEAGQTPKQFLQEVLISDPSKLDKLDKKESKKQKLLGDTFGLLVQHEVQKKGGPSSKK